MQKIRTAASLLDHSHKLVHLAHTQSQGSHSICFSDLIMHPHNTGRGRARGSGSWRGNMRGLPRGTSSSPARTPQPIPPALGQQIPWTRLGQIATDETKDTCAITNVEAVASYNLLEGLQRTILIPRRPPKWTPPLGEVVMEQDSGDYYRDENAARFPMYPLDPAVKAVLHMAPEEVSNLDVFGCGSTLGALLRFCSGDYHSFSFVVQMIGHTAFFLRRNKSPTEVIEDIRGYAHKYLETYTTWSKDVKGSASNQRIVAYDFGGLRFAVRFEADGYVVGETDEEDEENEGQSGVALEDDLANLLRSASAPTTQEELSTTFREQGRLVGQDLIVDVKTRAAYKRGAVAIAEQLLRLWVRQIQTLILGFHDRGRFETPEIINVTEKLHAWEASSQKALARLAAFISEIKSASQKHGSIEVRGYETGTLSFHELPAVECEKWNALSDEMQKQWIAS